MALFHVLEKEMKWREETGKSTRGFGALNTHKPIVAVGPEHALEDEILAADHFRKTDRDPHRFTLRNRAVNKL